MVVVVVVAGPDFQMSTLSVSSCLTQSPLPSARTTQQTLKLSLSPPSLLSTPDLDIIYGDTS